MNQKNSYEENVHADDLSLGNGSHYGLSECLEDDDLSMSVISTPFALDSRARNRFQNLSTAQDISKQSENLNLEPHHATNESRNVRDDDPKTQN